MTILVVALMFIGCAGYIRMAVYVADEIYTRFPNSDCSLGGAMWPLTLLLYAYGVPRKMHKQPLPKAVVCKRKEGRP